VVASVPHNYGANISLLAVLGIAGVGAQMTVEGAVDTAVFRAYVAQVLGPTLQPGDIVVLDNLSVHKVAGIAELIESGGHDCSRCPRIRPNSIPLSSARPSSKPPSARPRPALDAALQRALQTITPADAQAWFTHCGYLVHQ
jgi:hypothetical protein